MKKHTYIQEYSIRGGQDERSGEETKCSSIMVKGENPEQELWDMVLNEISGGYEQRLFVNDCDYDWPEISANPEGVYHCRTIPEHFAASYREAVSLLRSSGREPVALTLPPILPDRYLNHLCSRGASRENLLKWLGSAEELSMWQHTYSCLVRQIAREENVRLIDLRLKYPAEARDLEPLIGPDGIHPSASGQKLIFDVLCDDARAVLA